MGDWVGRKPLLAALALVALTLAAHAIILAAPGFYANDEWQKFDHLRLHGAEDFVRAYGTIRPGPEFGYPMRPLGFMQQGFAAQWMQSAPWLSHLVGVINHALVALTFVWVLRRAGVAAATAAMAGAFFVLSPLTTMATGWLAASFDQLYVLFLLFAAAAIVKLPAGGLSPARSVWLLLATTAALLAKETAIVAPAVVLLVAFMVRSAKPAGFSWRPYGVAFVITLLPVVAYLLFRAPAIAASLAGHADAAYTPDTRYAPQNAWRFFVFPFRLKLVEMSAAVFRSPWQPLAAATAHLLLIVAVGRLVGPRFAWAYVAGYFVFLLPVLMLPNPGVHCLYGAALAMALALAAVLARSWATRRYGLAALVLAGAGALLIHDVVIQRQLFDAGQCQARFLESVDATLATTPAGIVVVPEPDAAAFTRIAIRAVSAREAYEVNGRPVIAFDAPGQLVSEPPGADALRMRMTATCALQPEAATPR
jgi:hypothetical protein